MDLTILANFSQIRQSKINLGNEDFDEFFAIFVIALISVHVSILVSLHKYGNLGKLTCA